MPYVELFPTEQTIGIFRGFREGGLEFHADLVLPYRNDFHSIPMHGQFLLVQLESPDEAVLGRIASFSSEGKLSSGYGEEFNLRALKEHRIIPDDLREEYLKYKVNIRVLGVLRNSRDRLLFVTSHRRLPHVGSYVAFPSDAVLQEIVGHNIDGAEIGHFALGEYIYAQNSKLFHTEDWMLVKSPEISIKFPIINLVSRRTFIFARAGFGKSNLNKLLFSKLYERTPTITKRNHKQVPVGTIIFDPDGEYFWPDDKGRPGLCDVPVLQDKLVVFTPRKGPSPFYGSFIAGSIKLDIRRLSPSDVIGIALSSERQEQQNVRKLRGLNQKNWERLVNLIDQSGNQAPLDELCTLLGLETKQEVEALAARANMTTIVRMLHDKSSQFLDMLIYALSEGKLCVVDVSQMRGTEALVLSGLILRRIFDRNQKEFTEAEPKTIPTIAVVEEAQSVLNDRATAAEPYISWVKEGRKYDLGALLITQQPGSIPVDILSQGDNWFIFHLLSSTDLANLQRANAHFSADILSVLLNEPIPGQGVFWSSVGGTPYPVPIRVLSFEHLYAPLDPLYNRAASDTFAQVLKTKFLQVLEERLDHKGNVPLVADEAALTENGIETEPVDAMAVYKDQAIQALRNNHVRMDEIRGSGTSWGYTMEFLEKELPDTLENRSDIAYYLVREALERIFGAENEAWYTFKRPGNNGKQITCIRAGRKLS
jgi:DNA helicase HerA-like ATPase